MLAKQILLNSLAKDDFNKILKGFFFLAKKYKDEELHNNATFQSGRLSNLEKQRINGTISPQDESLQTAKIREALLLIIKSFPDNWVLTKMDKLSPVPSDSFKANWKKNIISFIAVIGLLAVILLLWTPISLKKYVLTKKVSETFNNVTLFEEVIGRLQFFILKNQKLIDTLKVIELDTSSIIKIEPKPITLPKYRKVELQHYFARKLVLNGVNITPTDEKRGIFNLKITKKENHIILFNGKNNPVSLFDKMITIDENCKSIICKGLECKCK